MTQIVPETDLAVGCVVWIKRRRCTIVDVHPVTGLRIFRKEGSDKDYSLDRHELQLLARRWDIVPDRIHQKLPPDVRRVMDTEWNLLEEVRQQQAHARAAVCRELDRLNPIQRRKEAAINTVIEEVSAKLGVKLPSAQRFRRHWDFLWIASLKDPRALVDLAHCRGNRRLEDIDGYLPVVALVDGLIEEMITSRLTNIESLSKVQQLADDLVFIALNGDDWRHHEAVQHIRDNIGEEAFEKHDITRVMEAASSGTPMIVHPRTDFEIRSIGGNLVRRRFARRNYFDRMAYRKNRKEARRLASGTGEGPIVDLPLQRVEADATPIDELTVIVGGKPKRMEITLFKDKCSGMITGLHHSFEPSNWFTVHEGFRMSALPKEDYLASFPYKFVNEWPSIGVPDVLAMDRAIIHRGTALAGMSTKLGFEIVDMPAARGDLKGGIEKSLGDFMREHIASRAYAGSNILERDAVRSVPQCTEEEAVEAALAYIVDYYNQQIEPDTGEIRSVRYKRLMDEALAWKLPPDPSLFPGKAVPATLTVKGIVINGLRYTSPDLHNMFFDAGENVDVLVFIPRFETDVVRVAQNDGRGNIDAYLQGQHAGLGLTYDQALARHRAAKRPKATHEQREKAVAGRLNYNFYHNDARGPAKRAKPVTRPPKKPGDDLAVTIVDAAVSAKRGFAGHDMRTGHDFETLGERGGAFARPGPASRAIENAVAAARDEEAVPAVPVSNGFMPASPSQKAKLPVSAAMASANTAPPEERKQTPPEPALSAMPKVKKAFKLK